MTTTVTGGGHVVRGLAIERGLRRNGFTGRYALFGPPLPYLIEFAPEYFDAEVTRAEMTTRAAALSSALSSSLRSFDPDLVLVDHFWLPLLFILPELACPKWLLLHTVPRGWLVGSPRLRFDRSQYDRVIVTEAMEHALPGHAEPIDEIPPIVIANPSEALPPGALKERLDVAPDHQLILVVQTGTEGEVDLLQRELASNTGQKTVVVPMTMRRGNAIFPIAPWLGGADHIVGGGGYNFFWETVWFGLTERTTYRPFFRTLDNQKWRVETQRDTVMVENGADVLARQILFG